MKHEIEIVQQEKPARSRGILQPAAVPMLFHGGAIARPNNEMWRLIAHGARVACKRCIEVVGPPNELVCRECPGVTLIKTIKKEAPAP